MRRDYYNLGSLLSQTHIMLGSCAACESPSRNLQPPSTVETNIPFVVSIKAFQAIPLRF